MTVSATPLAAPFAALAALLPESELAACEVASRAVEGLEDLEATAIRQFEAAGRECLAKLGADAHAALHILKSASIASLPAQREEGSRVAKEGVEGCGQNADTPIDNSVDIQSIRQMFEHFDTDGQGLLTKAQFRDVLLQMGMGEHFNSEEVDALVLAADGNHDNFVDLQEFTDWVCSGGDLLSPEVTRRHRESTQLDHEQAAENLRRELTEVQASLEESEARFSASEKSKALALKRADAAYDTEMEAMWMFWRSVAKTSASPKLAQAMDLNDTQLIGNGKYGYVFKSKRLEDGQPIVMKLSSLRWAHVAAKEWGQAQIVGSHAHIVEYHEAMLHADDDKCIANLLTAASEDGKLRSRVKKGNFPDRYICLLQEFMNRGTVQDWLDRGALVPGGLFVVMRCLADALAYMHQCGCAHNDVKPENVLLMQEDETEPHARMVVKLADLGLAAKSDDLSSDFAMYGMSVFCMLTGESLGARKFSPEIVDGLVSDAAGCVKESGAGACTRSIDRRILATLAELPKLLRKIWKREVKMWEVREWPSLQRWGFFDGEAPQDSADGHALQKGKEVYLARRAASVADSELLSAAS